MLTWRILNTLSDHDIVQVSCRASWSRYLQISSEKKLENTCQRVKDDNYQSQIKVPSCTIS